MVRGMKVFSAGDPMAMCKAGVEIHFKPIPRQTSKTKRDYIVYVYVTSSCDVIIIVVEV